MNAEPNPAPTPRTDAAFHQYNEDAQYHTFREKIREIERELAAKDAEIARLKAQDEFHWNIIKSCMDELEMVDMGPSMIRGEIQEWKCSHERLKAKEVAATDRAVLLALERDQLRAEVERLKVAQRERTQWKCACGGTDCDGQQENKLLRTEVERLKDFELNYETLTRLLHNRFKMKDGIMPDYKVEDVLVENNQLRAALAAKDREIELLRRDKFQLGEERRAEWTRAEKADLPRQRHLV